MKKGSDLRAISFPRSLQRYSGENAPRAYVIISITMPGMRNYEHEHMYTIMMHVSGNKILAMQFRIRRASNTTGHQ